MKGRRLKAPTAAARSEILYPRALKMPESKNEAGCLQMIGGPFLYLIVLGLAAIIGSMLIRLDRLEKHAGIERVLPIPRNDRP